MLDKLLGRAALKSRLAELEDENERLRKRYEAESERRSDAVTDKQEAEREQNKLEDRIAQLEGELDRLQEQSREGTGGSTLEFRRRERMGLVETEAALERLESVRTEPEGALTTLAGSDHPRPDALESVLGERASLVADLEPCVVCADDMGLVSVALVPPVEPELEASAVWDDRFRLEPRWFLPRGRFTLALVRADLFALGVYEADERVEFHGFESDVKGSHSKGGFSQSRFERIRDGQIADHLERARDALTEGVEGPLYLVGQREAIDRLAEKSGIDPTETATVDATGKPREALEDAYSDFFTTELLVL